MNSNSASRSGKDGMLFMSHPPEELMVQIRLLWQLGGLAMRVPVIRGIIDRRVLVNYRVDRDVLWRILPEPFRPKLVNGVGMAGVCLIRLKHIWSRFPPAVVGLSSENAAHRIAIEWERDGRLREGFYVPRRDTSSWLNSALGSGFFPGVHAELPHFEHGYHRRSAIFRSSCRV
jgi:hypothetical protein